MSRPPAHDVIKDGIKFKLRLNVGKQLAMEWKEVAAAAAGCETKYTLKEWKERLTRVKVDVLKKYESGLHPDQVTFRYKLTKEETRFLKENWQNLLTKRELKCGHHKWGHEAWRSTEIKSGKINKLLASLPVGVKLWIDTELYKKVYRLCRAGHLVIKNKRGVAFPRIDVLVPQSMNQADSRVSYVHLATALESCNPGRSFDYHNLSNKPLKPSAYLKMRVITPPCDSNTIARFLAFREHYPPERNSPDLEYWIGNRKQAKKSKMLINKDNIRFNPKRRLHFADDLARKMNVAKMKFLIGAKLKRHSSSAIFSPRFALASKLLFQKLHGCVKGEGPRFEEMLKTEQDRADDALYEGEEEEGPLTKGESSDHNG
jgi:hypothetical protein